MAASREMNLRIFRGLLRELKHAHQKKWQTLPALSYIRDQYHDHQVTSRKVCRGENEMRHLAQTYSCYLESLRKQQELRSMYQGRGERSVHETANLVGLEVPNNQDRK